MTIKPNESLANELHSTVTNMYTEVNNELGNRYQPFLNYGYQYSSSSVPKTILDPSDQEFHISAQLYQFVTSPTSLVDKDIVEVGSGRGGGSYYMKKYLGAKTVVGLEYLKQSVVISQKSFELEGLSFINGDAEELPFQDASKDIVVNIESSHAYPNVDNFFTESCRILKVGGYFCYADLTTTERRMEIEIKLDSLPMKRIRTEDITQNVIQSLTLDNSRKIALIKSMSLSDAREAWWLNEWGCVDTNTWNELKEGKLVYTCYALVKC